MTKHLYAIVLAGGSGQRLQELVRARFGEPIPKQYCHFDQRESLLQQTIRRLEPEIPSTRMTVVVDRSHWRWATPQLRWFPGIHSIDQPRGDRGTANGVLLPLFHVLQRDPQALVLITPSDHGINNETEFLRSLRRVLVSRAAKESNAVLFGVQPTMPATDFGWMVLGDPMHRARSFGLRSVERFVEKPERSLAFSLFSCGKALWNSMVVLARADRLLGLFETNAPESVAAFREAFQHGPPDEDTLASLYEKLPPLDFSRDILEKSSDLLADAWPLTMGWQDLGTPTRLREWLASGPSEDQPKPVSSR